MSSTSTIEEQARQWIDQLGAGTGLAGTWRLERLDFRSRYADAESSAQDSSGGEFDRRDLPRRIRRFCNGMPWALVNAAIKYLHESAPYSGLVYNGVPLDGRYVPVRTWWQRDEQSVVDKGQQVQGTYTLFQELVDVDRLDDLDFTSGGSCSQEVLSTYVWDAFDIEPVAADFRQGVSVSVQAMSRNEDGTFNYSVVKRVAKTQHMDWTVTKCDEFEQVEVETWDNLYGTPGAFVDDMGALVSVPAPCASEDGVVVEVQLQENEDCTFKAVAQRTTSKRVSSEELRKRSLYEDTHRTVRRAQDAPLASPSSGGAGGKVVSHRSELRPDGRYDNTVETEAERSVPAAEVVRSKSLRAVKRRMTDRNQALVRAAPLKVGESITVRKTDGGLYDVTTEVVDKEPVGVVGRECDKTHYQHVHTVRSNIPDDSSVPDDVADAGGGRTFHRSVALTDEGTYDVVEKTTTELPVRRAEYTKTLTLHAARTRVTHRSQSTTDGLLPSSLKVGESYTLRKTDGGLYDVVVDKVSPRGDGDIGGECDRTVLLHSHTDRSSRLYGAAESKPAADIGSGDVSAGTSRRRTVRLTDDGTYEVADTITQALPYGEQYTGGQKTARAERSTWSARNASQAPAVTRVGETVRGSINELGLVDYTREIVVPFRTSHLAEQQKTAFQTMTRRGQSDSEPLEEPVSFAAGTIVHVQATRDDDGLWTNTTETRTASMCKSWVTEISANRQYFWQISFRNATGQERQGFQEQMEEVLNSKQTTWARGDRAPASATFGASCDMNDFELFDGSFQISATWTAGQAGLKDELDELYFKEDAEMYGRDSRAYVAAACGRGRKELRKFLMLAGAYTIPGAPGKASWEPSNLHMNFSYDPLTQHWSASWGNAHHRTKKADDFIL